MDKDDNILKSDALKQTNINTSIVSELKNQNINV